MQPSQPSPTPSFVVRADDRFFTRIILLIIALIGFYLFVHLLPRLSSAIVVLVIAILITAVLDPLVGSLVNRGINRIGATVIVFGGLLLIIYLGIRILFPVISEQIESLASSLHNQSPEQIIATLQVKLAEKFPLLKNPKVSEQIAEKIQGLVVGFMELTFSAALGILISVPKLIITGFCVFFFLMDGWRIKRALIQAMPNRYFEISLILVHKVVERLGKYIRGQLIVASAVGIMSITALTLLDIRYSFFIGSIAGLANLIPYFGPIAGAIPAIAIGLIDKGSFGIVLAIAGAFATVQLIENIFISPYIVSKSVELHPLAIIVVLLIGGSLLGLWGLLLAVPVAGITKVIFTEIRWGVQNYRIKERAEFAKRLKQQF